MEPDFWGVAIEHTPEGWATLMRPGVPVVRMDSQVPAEWCPLGYGPVRGWLLETGVGEPMVFVPGREEGIPLGPGNWFEDFNSWRLLIGWERRQVDEGLDRARRVLMTRFLPTDLRWQTLLCGSSLAPGGLLVLGKWLVAQGFARRTLRIVQDDLGQWSEVE